MIHVSCTPRYKMLHNHVSLSGPHKYVHWPSLESKHECKKMYFSPTTWVSNTTMYLTLPILGPDGVIRSL